MRTTILPLLTSLALTGAAFAAEAPKPIAKAAAPVQPAAKPAADADMMMGGEMMMMSGKAGEFTPEQLAFFESKIRPILADNCYKCHSATADKVKGALVMDTKEGLLKGGTVYGATDEFGARAVEDKVHVHDLHATILALLGFDHTKLTYRYNGRDFRFTDNFGQVVKNVIA